MAKPKPPAPKPAAKSITPAAAKKAMRAMEDDIIKKCVNGPDLPPKLVGDALSRARLGGFS